MQSSVVTTCVYRPERPLMVAAFYFSPIHISPQNKITLSTVDYLDESKKNISFVVFEYAFQLMHL